MPSYHLKYKRDKIKSKNFIPTIKFFLDEEEEDIYVPPIGEYVEEKKQDLIIEDEDEEEQPQTALLLEELINELKKKRSVRTLELWITKNRKRIKELNDGDMGELLDYINGKYYNKDK